MDAVLVDIPPLYWAFSIAVALFAGLVKGVVGFAMPLIMISLMGSFLPPDLALAGLMMPTLVANGFQATRDGVGAALGAMKQFRIFLLTALIVLVFAAQLYAFLSASVLFAAIGIPVILYCLSQIAGWRLTLPRQILWVEVSIGALAGFFGGLAGIWGPAMVTYLTALNTEKRLQMRAQGAAFGLGALILLIAHGPSGVVRTETLVFSTILVFPALAGLWMGFQVQDRINQTTFRTATLWVLLVAGLNLLRRAYFAA